MDIESTLYIFKKILILKVYLQEVIGNSVNGTTYAGLRARTTGAPQNHWSVQNFLNFFILHVKVSECLNMSNDGL